VRTYGQFCGVARALDVVGDRWSLLIVRELLLRTSCRYTDLQRGLPGIATNLLADRLRHLEEAGVVRRVDVPAPVPGTVYELTEWGAELRATLEALGTWGGRLMARPQDEDAFRSYWLAFPIGLLTDTGGPGAPPVTIEVRTGDQPVVVTVDGQVRAEPGQAAHPDAVIEGAPDAVVALLLGRRPSDGVRIEGDAAALHRLGPPAATGGSD
jgi:DNA-binding HxlR family transcriptional regulator